MKVLKQIKTVASALMTIASFAVMVIAFCAVEIKEFSLTPFLAACAWLAFVFYKGGKGGEE